MENLNTSENFVKEFGEAMRPCQFLETLFNATPNLHFFIKNIRGEFVAFNNNLMKSLDCQNPEELIGRTDYDYTPSFLADIYVKDDKALIASGKPIIEKLELAPSDELIPDWRLTTKIPIFGKDGSVIGLAGLTRMLKSNDPIYLGHSELGIAIDYIKQNYMKKISIIDVAKKIDMSVSSVERLFKQIFKTTPIKYIKKIRLNAACRELRLTENSIAQIAENCGFYDQSSMNRDFRTILNLTPYHYRKKYRRDKNRQ